MSPALVSINFILIEPGVTNFTCMTKIETKIVKTTFHDLKQQADWIRYNKMLFLSVFP